MEHPSDRMISLWPAYACHHCEVYKWMNFNAFAEHFKPSTFDERASVVKLWDKFLEMVPHFYDKERQTTYAFITLTHDNKIKWPPLQ